MTQSLNDSITKAPMAQKPSSFRRSVKALHRRSREFKMIVKGLLSTDHPVQAQIIPMRRCNLACAYCNEYDDVSKAVPKEEMFHRIDHLAKLGTTIIVISGGEPLLHPDLDEIIARIRSHSIIAGMITNGYLLVPERIERLNRAGLEHLQISIDNVTPDDISKKSLKVLDKKLQLLADYAEFHVNINSVIGGGIQNPEDAVVIGRRARELGFTSTVGIIHNHIGQLKPLSQREQTVYRQMKEMNRSSYSRLNKFQENIALGRPNDWRCRSGSRYLYICEDGLVHYCSQQRGTPGVPLLEYTVDDIRREFLIEKHCAPNCTISCAHQTSYMDYWRAPQQKLLTLKKARPELFVQIASPRQEQERDRELVV
ncbi:MAG TPA: radical SAM protein [Terriglobales bacterium]|jgi:MoaA/NifB/PqqE/SkfB family radical SAM enzyme|nr:radical SAM protein [Terriglobales bacterium]